jgi:hypothetical protein
VGPAETGGGGGAAEAASRVWGWLRVGLLMEWDAGAERCLVPGLAGGGRLAFGLLVPPLCLVGGVVLAHAGIAAVSAFLAWIGSPCLRHCVHGASIGVGARGACGVAAVLR